MKFTDCIPDPVMDNLHDLNDPVTFDLEEKLVKTFLVCCLSDATPNYAVQHKNTVAWGDVSAAVGVSYFSSVV